MIFTRSSLSFRSRARASTCTSRLEPRSTMETRARPLALALSLAFALAPSGAAGAQSIPDTREYSRKGEVSVGAQAPSATAMVAAIDHGSPDKLKATLEYGERVLCTACVPLLQSKLLTSSDARVRELSAWWLRRQPFAAPAILANLKTVVQSDPTADRRARAAEALGEFMDPHALEALVSAARNDSEATVRSAAVRALARLNDEGAGPTLAAALADPALDVRNAALDVAIVARGFRDRAALLPLLGDADPSVRAHAARLCGEFRLAAAEGTLSAMLAGDPAASARKSAAWALGRIGGAAGVAALAQRQGVETDPLVRSAIDIAQRMRPRVP